MPKATIADVAALAGVSKATVSKVLNRRYDVNAATSDRVLKVVDQLGFVKDRRALQLARGRSDALGLIVPSGTDDWMIEVLRGAMEAAQAAHFAISLQTFPEEGVGLERTISALGGRMYDGVLVVQPRERLDWLVRLAESGLATVVIDDHGTNPSLNAFVPDEASGIDQAVEHLVHIGRTNFALLRGAEDERTRYTTEIRQAFYREALARRDLTLRQEAIVPADYSVAGGEQGTHELLRRGVRFDALIASSDAMAVGALRTLKAAGLSVPRAVSVVGFDDFPSAVYTDPRLTTIHNPLFEMSLRAIKKLIDIVDGDQSRDESVRQVVETRLVIRESSDPTRS